MSEGDKYLGGPGYPSPIWAMKNGPREKILYVVTVQPNENDENGDYLSTVDVDPESQTYCQVISRAFAGKKGQEFHHIGWNTCSSCHSCCGLKRDKLILPCLKSDSIYIFDVGADSRNPKLFKVIDGEILRQHNVSAPHTSHCLADGNIMISTMGDALGNASGDFILFDNKNFDFIGRWTNGNLAPCGYDFWYQPYFNLMVSTEWGAPNLWRRGFHPSDIESDKDYGRRLNVYDWKEHKLIDSIHLGDEGIAPLEVRFMHNPKRCEGFIGACLFAKVFRFYKKNPSDVKFTVEKVIDVPAKKVEGWAMPELNGMMSDILLSLDDRFLYFGNWFHGDVRQYDVTDPANPKLTGQVFLGGLIVKDSNLKVLEDKELSEKPDPVFVKGRRIYGGPQMMQLSLDGKRLYASTSLFSTWDKQFFPEMVKNGGTIVQLDIDNVNGGMKLNENFLVDFANEPNGPTLPHEMRYPGGDCTSDIWLASD